MGGLKRRRGGVDDVAGQDPGDLGGKSCGPRADHDVVPPGHAEILFERAREPRKLCLLPGAGHRLSDPLHRLEAVKRSLDWFTRHLHEEPA